MPASKYLHVTWRSRLGKPWQAMVCGEYLGTFATEEEASQAEDDKLGRPKRTLLRSRSSSATPKTIAKLAKPAKRSHRYVYWHRAESKWQVKIGTNNYGKFAEHDEALAVATHQTGLTIEDLQLRPDHVRMSLRLPDCRMLQS